MNNKLRLGGEINHYKASPLQLKTGDLQYLGSIWLVNTKIVIGELTIYLYQ